MLGSLKGSKYTLLKAENKLYSQQKEKLQSVKEASPLIEVMHSLKEELHQIFEETTNSGEGTLKLINWLETAQNYYKKSVSTMKRWFAEIVGYFENRTTNGIVEGINNKLKLLKRCGFGFRNFHNFELETIYKVKIKEMAIATNVSYDVRENRLELRKLVQWREKHTTVM